MLQTAARYLSYMVISALEILKVHWKIMEQHFQDVAQNILHDNNSDSFATHFAKKFTLKPIPQQCHKIMSFGIISTVNHISSIKTWGKLSWTLCTKERIKIIYNWKRTFGWLINTWPESYTECRHIPILHRFTRNWWYPDSWNNRDFKLFKSGSDQKIKLFPVDR